jgi:hypothetical protein
MFQPDLERCSTSSPEVMEGHDASYEDVDAEQPAVSSPNEIVSYLDVEDELPVPAEAPLSKGLGDDTEQLVGISQDPEIAAANDSTVELNHEATGEVASSAEFCASMDPDQGVDSEQLAGMSQLSETGEANDNTVAWDHEATGEVVCLTEGDEDSEQPGMSQSAIQEPITVTQNIMRASRGVSLNDFSLLALLGKGNFGKVMLAKEKCTNTYHAIKILKKEYLLDSNDVHR